METVQTKNNKNTDVPVQQGVENYKKIAAHLESAAKHHLLAASDHEAGNHEKAAKNTLAAYGHVTIAAGIRQKEAELYVPADQPVPNQI